MKVLLINSDLAKNRGDRAIAEGIIELIRSISPSADITAISEQAERDEKWFGVSFLNMDVHSLNPLDLLKLLSAAKKSDVVLWGGGELLKDYTNKLSLWYWAIKMMLVSTWNKKTYGVYQGIGPTSSSFSKKIICFIVGRCRKFIVRDETSFEKLVSWGVPRDKLILSTDPAIVPLAKKIAPNDTKLLERDFSLSPSFMNNFICIAPREWFHYRPGGFVPYKWRRKVSKLFMPKTGEQKNATQEKYHHSIVAMVDHLTSLDYNVLLLPMHMDEEDSKLCAQIQNSSAKPDQIKILGEDTVSPQLLRSVIAKAKFTVGFRLHSTILATSSYVPSFNFYYVDKGLSYFKQIKQADLAASIEQLIDDPAFTDSFARSFKQLANDRQARSLALKKQVGHLRTTAHDALEQIIKEGVST